MKSVLGEVGLYCFTNASKVKSDFRSEQVTCKIDFIQNILNFWANQAVIELSLFGRIECKFYRGKLSTLTQTQTCDLLSHSKSKHVFYPLV